MAIADDKKVSPGLLYTDASSALAELGRMATNKIQNLFAAIMLPFNDTICNPKTLPITFTRSTPLGDTDMAGLPIGSLCLQLEITATAASGIYLFLKTGTGAYDWESLLTAPSSTSRTAFTAAKSMVNIRGTNSGTGDFRAIYARIELTHASGGSGDALRGYALAKGGVTACRGAHLTAEVAAGGSVVGVAAGATIQATTAADLTLSGGTLAAVDLVGDFSSAITGMTSVSFIRVSDNQTAKTPVLIAVDSSATGVVGATTAATAAGTLKVSVSGVVKYIQLYSSAS